MKVICLTTELLDLLQGSHSNDVSKFQDFFSTINTRKSDLLFYH